MSLVFLFSSLNILFFLWLYGQKTMNPGSKSLHTGNNVTYIKVLILPTQGIKCDIKPLMVHPCIVTEFQNKIEMLDNLLELEVAYSLLKTGNEGGKDPLDVHYEQLKTKISPMEKESEDYKRLLTYVNNTHASTHNQYDLEVQEVRITPSLCSTYVR